MNGLDSREQRKAHVKALAEELEDLNRGRVQAEARLNATPEDKIVKRAHGTERLQHLDDRIAAVKDQLRSFASGARSPREGAETRSGGATPAVELPSEPTPAPKAAPKPSPKPGAGQK